jgi:hypothetical protein
MKPTVTIEVPADSVALVQQLLALHQEMESLALTAADGTVLDACELAILEKGPNLSASILSQAVARRVEAAEKKGRRSESAPVGEPRRTAAKPRVSL